MKIGKKFIQTTMVLGMSAVLSLSTFAMSFADMDSTHWAYESAVYMHEQKLMLTSSSGEFYPSQLMSTFDVIDMLAKATGYVDTNVTTDEALKQEIQAMYDEYIKYVTPYDEQYDAWNTSSNERLTYMLAKGYLKPEELPSFMTLNGQGEAVKSNIKKEDLAVYLVRILGKEEEAIEQYKAGAFTDEAQIAEAKRPHVAYLNLIGLVNGDAQGAFGAGQELTRGIVAKMTSDVLQIMEVDQEMPTADGTIQLISDATDNTYIYDILIKGQGFFKIDAQTDVKDAEGKSITAADIQVDDEVEYVVRDQTNYIKSIQIIKEEVAPQVDIVAGEYKDLSRYGNLTIETSKGEEAYPIKSTVEVIFGGEQVGIGELQEGDLIRAYVTDGEVTRIVIDQKVQEDNLAGVELVSAKERQYNYTFEIQDGDVIKEVVLDKDIYITRNDKEVQFVDLKKGDTLTFMSQNGDITGIMATSEETTITGTVNSIKLGAEPTIEVVTANGVEKVVISPASELYDRVNRKEISVRDLNLYSTVEVDLDSREVVALEVTKAPSSVTYKGVIQYVGEGARYIDVLVEYDRLSQESMIVKRISVPGDTRILEDGKDKYRSILVEGMEVLITYSDGQILVPNTIEILN